MIRTFGIYIYAGLIVIGTIFKLQGAKKLFKQESSREIDKQLFEQPRMVSRKVIRRTGTSVHVKGQEKLPDEAVLFVANHQGLFDILALLGYVGKPLGFIAKKETEKLPIISTWMKLIYCVFIDRKDRRQSVRAINQGIEHLKNGHSLVIFPEGTRSRGSNLNTFKSGSFRLAIKANVPIVPVAIDGTYQMLEEDDGRVKASTIFMRIEDPIYPEDYQAKKSGEIASYTQEIIKKSLQSNSGMEHTSLEEEPFPHKLEV